MTVPHVVFAAAALLPAMTGSPPAAQDARGLLTVALCQGGSMTLALGGATDRAPATVPCCAKGCHSSHSRRRIDRQP